MRLLPFLVASSVLAVFALNGCCTASRASLGATGFAIGNADRVVVYGDSITAPVDMPSYPRYLETYIRCRYPDWQGELWNRGLPGDWAGNIARYREQCLALNPTFITFNMGMNDSGWGDVFGDALAKYRKNLAAIVAETKARTPNATFVLSSSIPYEMNADYMLGAKASIQKHFADAARDVAAETGVRYVDTNKGYTDFLGAIDVLNPGVVAFSNDGVHPGVMGGHFMLAVALIEGLGADPFLASATIDAATARVLEAKGEEVADVAAASDGITFTRRLMRSPFPAISQIGEMHYGDRALYGRFDIANRLNRDTVKVVGLADGNYDVSIDGTVFGTYSAAEFAKGVNFGAFCNSPDFERACQLSGAIGNKQVAQRLLMEAELEKNPNADRIAGSKALLQLATERIEQWMHPLARRIEIKKTARKFNPATRVHDTVSIFPNRRQKMGDRGFGNTAVIEARDDGRFVGEYDFLIRNNSDQVRRAEVSASKGFTPVGRKFVLKPGEMVTLKFAYDLPPDVEPPVVKMRQYRDDLLDVPTVMQYPFECRRCATFAADAQGVRATTLELGPQTEGDRARSVGAADLSAVAELKHVNGTMSIKVVVHDADHVNAFTHPDCINWDDSLSVGLGSQWCSLAFTKKGPMMSPANAFGNATFDVQRDEAAGTTTYSLAFPYDMKEEISASFSVFDRDSSQQVKFAKWSGRLLCR